MRERLFLYYKDTENTCRKVRFGIFLLRWILNVSASSPRLHKPFPASGILIGNQKALGRFPAEPAAILQDGSTEKPQSSERTVLLPEVKPMGRILRSGIHLQLPPECKRSGSGDGMKNLCKVVAVAETAEKSDFSDAFLRFCQ